MLAGKDQSPERRPHSGDKPQRSGERHRLERMSSRINSSSLLLLLLLDELALDHDLDLIADDPLAIKHGVECHTKVLAVDLALGAVADAVAHIGIIEFSVLHHRKRYRPGVALDGEISSHGVAILSCRFDLGAFEVNRRILVD